MQKKCDLELQLDSLTDADSIGVEIFSLFPKAIKMLEINTM